MTTKTQFLNDLAADRADNLSIDKLLRDVAADYRAGRVARQTATQMLLEAGACVPEINEALS